jgi:FtsH-binding integral membrane protein
MHWANTGSLIATAAFIGVAVIGIADKPVPAAAAGIFLVAAFVLGIIGVINSGRKKDKSGRGWGLAGIILGALVILFELAELIFD